MNPFYSNKWFHEKFFEPAPRLHGGVYGYVGHRFPIKGGISFRDVLLQLASKPNPLLNLVKEPR